ncbi:response regulator transcription factor [Clostridium weizhouense]|uniref:Stage 0 sporulation protein A homolog n=1 Tax=Clostridium weizhouense TaxID=2859781 RepID=A0ABS7AR40_9CLOT|nr:response regulator transcription factor [Clostridium weizhouense]MBW6411140.1 response regulator transcription factor [Clostridium weizhouense]
MDNFIERILMVDSDKSNNEIVSTYLKSSGYKTKSTLTGEEFKKSFLEYNPQMILLNLIIKDIDGTVLLKWIRTKSSIPIIIVTEEERVFNKVLALNLGADDYILKPFELEELLARINAVSRRYCKGNFETEKKSVDNLIINDYSYEVICNGKNIKLPPKEFKLLNFLIDNPNKIYTRKQLLSEIWRDEYIGDIRTIDVHIKRLRKRIGKSEKWEIKTIWGVGYKFQIN